MLLVLGGLLLCATLATLAFVWSWKKHRNVLPGSLGLGPAFCGALLCAVSSGYICFIVTLYATNGLGTGGTNVLLGREPHDQILVHACAYSFLCVAWAVVLMCVELIC